MKKPNSPKRDLYYTNDHEWIDFQGSVAYVGLCQFKLKGIKQVQQIHFSEGPGSIKKGEILATIQYDDYRICLQMPVDGKVLSINEAIFPEGQDLLLKQPESNGWVALIVPSQPYERQGLLAPEQYKLTTTRNF